MPEKKPRRRKKAGVPAIARPRPEECRRPGAPGGIPVTLADGNAWEVARGGLWRRLTPFRDRIFDVVVLSQTAEVPQLRAALFLLLRVNYDLPDEELQSLVLATEPSAFADQVVEAVLPVDPPRRGFTAWARASLIANGIRPEDVPPDDLPHVLAVLEGSRRTVPYLDYTESGEAAQKRAGLMAVKARIEGEAGATPRAITRETE